VLEAGNSAKLVVGGGLGVPRHSESSRRSRQDEGDSNAESCGRNLTHRLVGLGLITILLASCTLNGLGSVPRTAEQHKTRAKSELGD